MNLRIGSIALLAAMVAFSGIAYAEKEEVILKDGTSGFVEVVETTRDGLTVKGSVQDSAVTMSLKAAQLDPHSFYQIRRRHMEPTAQNHWDLAKFCLDSGIVNRAVHEAKVAESIDAEFVAKQKAIPEVREGAADTILRFAKQHFEDDKLALAKEEISLLLTKLGDTRAAANAEAMLTVIERREVELAEEEEEAALKALDEEKKAAAEALLKKLKSAKTSYEYGKEILAGAMREKNENNAKKAYTAAAAEFERALAKARAVIAKEPGDVAGRFAAIEKRVMGETVDAYINAGRIELNRASFNQAADFGNRALEVDPDSAAANAFLQKVALAEVMNDDWRGRGVRRVRGGRR